MYHRKEKLVNLSQTGYPRQKYIECKPLIRTVKNN